VTKIGVMPRRGGRRDEAQQSNVQNPAATMFPADRLSPAQLLVYRHGVPDIRWPGGTQIAVSVGVNIEEGAELSLGL